jgi:hypothetical protein
VRSRLHQVGRDTDKVVKRTQAMRGEPMIDRGCAGRSIRPCDAPDGDPAAIDVGTRRHRIKQAAAGTSISNRDGCPFKRKAAGPS